MGVDIHKEIDKAFGNNEYGLSMTVAGGALIGFLFFLFFAVSIFLIKLLTENITFPYVHFILCAAVSVVLSYIFVFKKDKYLKYFEMFEGWGKAERRKYGLITFVFALLVFCLFILSIKI